MPSNYFDRFHNNLKDLIFTMFSPKISFERIRGRRNKNKSNAYKFNKKSIHLLSKIEKQALIQTGPLSINKLLI